MLHCKTQIKRFVHRRGVLRIIGPTMKLLIIYRPIDTPQMTLCRIKKLKAMMARGQTRHITNKILPTTRLLVHLTVSFPQISL